MLNSLLHNESRVAVPQAGPCSAKIAIASADICRENCSSHKYSRLKYGAVRICSLPCDISIVCKIRDAARATFAAPTFFSVMRIQDRSFADRGLGHNSLFFAIYYPHTRIGQTASVRQTAASTSESRFSPHGDLECSRVRFPHIGTGAKKDEVEPGKREWLAGLLPQVIKELVFLKQILTDIAVNSKERAEIVRIFQELNPDAVMYERFDADHGVSRRTTGQRQGNLEE